MKELIGHFYREENAICIIRDILFILMINIKKIILNVNLIKY